MKKSLHLGVVSSTNFLHQPSDPKATTNMTSNTTASKPTSSLIVVPKNKPTVPPHQTVFPEISEDLKQLYNTLSEHPGSADPLAVGKLREVYVLHLTVHSTLSLFPFPGIGAPNVPQPTEATRILLLTELLP